MRRAALLILFAVLAVPPAGARTGRQEVVPAERRVLPYDANIPGCQDSGVLAKVAQINRTHFHNLITKHQIPRPFPAKTGNWVTATSVRSATSPPRVVGVRTFAATKPHSQTP